MGTQFVTISGFMTTADVDAHPEHPIVIPPPENIPTHPIVLPPLPPLVSDGVPTHPIYIPPGTWGGAGEPFPTPPIAPGGPPPVIWGGGNQPFPTPPIYLPDPVPPAGSTRDEWSWAFSPYYGWIVLPPETAARPKAGKK